MVSIISTRQQPIESLPICGQYVQSYCLDNPSMMSFNPNITDSILNDSISLMIDPHSLEMYK